MALLALLLPCLLAPLGGVVTMASQGPSGQHPQPLPDTTLELMDKFKEFQIRYNKSYEDQAEHARRFEIFVQNLARARKLQEEDQGTAEFGVTPFSDLSEDEFLSLYAPRFRMPTSWVNQTARIPAGPLRAETCDWRKEGAVTPVKNQVLTPGPQAPPFTLPHLDLLSHPTSSSSPPGGSGSPSAPSFSLWGKNHLKS
ncbi:cathepsin W-like [Ornithorhynchus anatinus]|uniref:cathepsin W-like n=1 Tax=Ornithorhynchus anatinus TaxID=9258 RepID=UPI0019D4BE5B|nr:cathepsin W-like [Ornithorhynchus anatinus]